MKILVTGGAGYIGSITAQELNKIGHQVVIFDSLVHGHKQAVAKFKTVVGETQDKSLLSRILKEERIEAVIHFAAFIEMGESMQDPYKYFENNAYGSLQLMKAMVEIGIDALVFSSTAGVYGNPKRLPIREDDPKEPTNPYGESKLMVEQMLKWFDEVHNLRSITLRYFNAAGATLEGKLGEAHEPESHLLPKLLSAALTDESIIINGNDYPTPDRTCIRDYIHVLDLAQAHIVALENLRKGHKTDVYNVGTGRGYSNKEVLKVVEQITGKKLIVQYGPRRPGDAAELVADSSKLQQEFSWKPRYSDLKTIVETAWTWHQRNNQ